MKGKYYTLFVLSLLVLGSFSSQAQDFVYQPVNPAFGGYYYNYQWLLSSAQVQNTYEDKGSQYDPYQTDPLEDFQNSLNRQILSQISRQVILSEFGEGPLTAGQYSFGSYEIDVKPGDNGVEVNILDTSTGNETKVTIPYF